MGVLVFRDVYEFLFVRNTLLKLSLDLSEVHLVSLCQGPLDVPCLLCVPLPIRVQLCSELSRATWQPPAESSRAAKAPGLLECCWPLSPSVAQGK